MRKMWLAAAAFFSSVNLAAAEPAQNGLSGWLEMRTPGVVTAPTVYGALRGARMIPSIGNHTYVAAGYNQAFSDDGEWGVQVPLAITRAGTGLHQLFAGGKYRFVNSDVFDLAVAGYLLLPGNIGVTETGTGQLGLGGDLEMLVEQAGVQLALDLGAERADHCRGCPRPGVIKAAKAVAGLDGAVGLRVPIEQFAVVAEYHLAWNYSDPSHIDDSDMYAEIGGQIPIVDRVSLTPFVGKGFGTSGVHENTVLFGGLTGSYTF